MTHPSKPNAKGNPIAPEWRWFWDKAIFAAPILQGAMSTPDYVSRLMMAPTTSPRPPAMEMGINGWCVDINADDEGLFITTPEYARVQPPVTICFGMTRLGNPDNNAIQFGILHNNNDNSPFTSYIIGSAASSEFRIWTNNGGVFDALNLNYSYAAWAANEVHDVAVVFKSTDSHVYVDGKLMMSDILSAFSNVQFGATSQIQFGNIDKVNRNANSRFCYGYIFNCRLTEPQINQIHVDPYGAFRSWRSSAFLVTAPVGAKLYYSGGSIAAQRLNRGIGWVQ